MRTAATLVPLLVVVALSGCATAPRPTQPMLEAAFAKPKKTGVFALPESPAVLQQRLIDRGCGPDRKTSTMVTTAATVTTTVDLSLDHGEPADGSRWVALRVDGMMSLLATGVWFTPRADGGSDVRVAKVDQRKLDQARAAVQDGSYFCVWRDLDYPYD